ncbi:hypothetical protein EKO04_008944 [Ascochyta lentis]|uniref:Protein kinase domain-containing protein n=1 Tax=Ascochyta lentis TaxID=205686 RepID=A0A8H7IYF9_9PLEO|nr:hypothetical protein EKO04_008944 [Ascochyta lentis]
MHQTLHINTGPRGFISEQSCDMVVLRGHTRFSVKVDATKVDGTGLGKKMLQEMELWKGLPCGRARDEPILNLIYQHCLPVFEKLAPETSLQNLSVESFLQAPSFNLELAKEDGEDVRITGDEDCLYTPAFFTAPIPTADLPKLGTSLRHLQARDIQIAPPIDEGRTLNSIQGRVVTADGTHFFFKPRLELRERDFERELCILSRIDEAGLAPQFRVPKLHGLVVSGNMTVGLLMTMVTQSTSGTHLRCPGLQERLDLHEKWEKQLAVTVRELHAHGIVWGDVHPMNILIDESMDAWAIDFGGMNNVEFVDDEKRETVEGDWQGLNRVFQEWLPDPQRRVRL